ncbi:phytanoyl-CoA dioxygenase family protein [Kitasatospora sp. NPDC001664]
MSRATTLDTPGPGQSGPAAERLRTHGFTVVPGIVSDPLLGRLREEADTLVTGFTEGHRAEDYWSFTAQSSGQEVLYRIHNLDRQSGAPLAAGLFAAGPLHHLATQLLGCPVRARVMAMIVKMPQLAAPVPWHRDRVDTPPGTAINLSLFLDASDPGNGCLEFVPGSHHQADEADVAALREAGPVHPVSARAGDVAVHDVRVVHASRANPSVRPRRSICIEFVPMEAAS